MPEWRKIKTACRDCVFAEWQDKTQIGCEYNRIYKHGRQGSEIVRVFDENNIEFFVINGRVCQYYRRLDWKNAHENDNLINIIKKEIELNYTLFLSIKNKPIDEILQHVNNLDILPTKLFIINRQETSHTKTIIKKWKRPWEEMNVAVEHPDYWFAHSAIMTNRVQSLLYLIQSENELENLNSFVNKLNHSINEELQQIECITDDDKVIGGLVLLHKIYGWNYISEVKDKNNILYV